MQGKYGSESGLPLNELLTVVLVTHNRPAFVRRAVKFYSTLPCRILLLDSSTHITEGIDGVYPSVDYRHLPQFGYQGLRAKLHYGVQHVTTPYMAFAADDDFIVHDALDASVSFLEENPDYGMCHGYCLMYLALASSVSYYRRDKKVCEDYSSERAQDRVIDFMQQYIPPFYAVHRTELLRDWYAVMPEDTIFEWQEIGHAYYMLAMAKARILPIPYVVREVNYLASEHNTEVYGTLTASDAKSVADRERFAQLLSTLPSTKTGLDPEQGKQLALDSFEAMADCLRTGRSLTAEPIFESRWTNVQKGPDRRFGLLQYVELPYYNQQFFDLLSQYEFLLHAMPAGRVQLQGLEGIWAHQEDMMRPRNNDTVESVVERLWHAYDSGPFNRQVVKRLAQQLELLGEADDARDMSAWAERLDAVSTRGNEEAFGAMRSGRLLKWLVARTPDADEVAATSRYLAAHNGGPQFGILVLDLDNDAAKLQITLDSLLEGHNHAFKIVVFTTGKPLAATTVHNTLHFVCVTQANYVDKLNQIARQSPCDWLLLTEAGDEFTAGGLLRAGLELHAAPDCRAVAVDEIQRDPSGALVDVFRPGFNLDLLQSLPTLMAQHWLIRKDVLLEAGGYQADFSKALEFDLLLRIIEQGGLAWLAHLDEPLLITRAPVLEDNAHERQALIRHLATRGYKAQISSAEPGTYQIDYRHTERPLVSIILASQDNLEQLQRCLTGIVQRTRYTRYEVLIADNASQSPDILQWLDGLGQPGDKVRVLRAHERLSQSALYNEASQQAQGEYLVLLAADSEVVNPNWLESLLNQAQRPEVGVVGVKLLDRDGKVTQAGLILGMNDSVGSAFVGEPKDAKGYLNRLVLEQNYSAVSAVCLMIRKALFDEVGGLDEHAFANAYGDVDLCLKAGQAGYLVVWTPQVQVIHPGTLPDAPQVLAALREKWAGPFQHDLAYNKNLALTGKGFTLDNATSVDWARLLV
ncbi:TIGR00180 family glycosyltransferase [Pseudomonas sp. H3(2019)]|uniref:TIGR00180 family glycosyltransferase n=1 Tax=Pseudomonas sp. H3(2019) TaxID=2598724 RepID=UPI001192C900|nr:TIGR00180 family glycosyltransferase [Pseudomonas sp. H3(2019)]TVT85792.1 TIGR00180 family glycosyltransferase [Pseudomonas sp. H3(2019)]